MASRNAIALTVTGRAAGHNMAESTPRRTIFFFFFFRGASQSNKARTLGKR